jgi:hypothetical protein
VRRRLTALCLDIVVVLGFVALGRRSHSEGEALAGIAVVVAPFLVGLTIGWAAIWRGTRQDGWRAGFTVWASTVVVGLALRSLVFGRATPPAFMLVAAGFLAVGLLGWRMAWRFVARRRAIGAAADGSPADA